ncbi:hypothetical protein [Entomospira culicis]|uniref:Lipoprotein n=1 Tax=Entomospira culicis TaxID=2719989 RepID=A0A968GGX7_9SPIO|nr:hypothetical protein [Entomospira culicis]NIZ19921.1 hypothetical protein [Entomospira culicis]NIZ70122.1 hypothetical protein [Entomospira culicis]WDI38049.1 hypothetical protein PVA46_07875 [Entomospira culicis]WDI39672.1 hypothetical protein PVA47_07875 [Entomospira culicis]
MRQFWLASFLLIVLLPISYAQSLTQESGHNYTHAIFTATKENQQAKSAGRKVLFPEAQKLLDATQKEYKTIGALSASHTDILEAIDLAKGNEVTPETYFLTVSVFEQMGVNDALFGLNFIVNKFALYDYQLNQQFSRNQRWQDNNKALLGKSYEHTYMDKVILYLILIDFYPDVRKDAMRNIFKGENAKLVAAMAKVAPRFHGASIEIRKSEKTKTRIQQLLDLSKQESAFNQELYVNFLERAFGGEAIAQWQEANQISPIDESAGQLALSLAVMVLHPDHRAEQIAAYQAIYANEEAAQEAQRAQSKLLKAVSGFFAKFEKNKNR